MATGVDTLSGSAAGRPAAERPTAAANDADPTAGMVARVRLLMIISALTTVIAIAAVLGVVGYRLFRAGGSPGGSIDNVVALPQGARVVSTVVSDGRIVVTLDIGGTSEIRIYDVGTLRPVGRLRFAPTP